MILPGRWVRMRNRDDEVEVNPNGAGVHCKWMHTRQLHLCNVFPVAARWLLQKAVKHHPIRFQKKPDHISDQLVCFNEATDLDAPPEVSFLIGHRGLERLPLLLTTLQSIAAQKGVSFECIVVEQDRENRIQGNLPDWVRYRHCPLPDPDHLYNRSQAFNAAARIAKGKVLILHDNDMLIPVDYATETIRTHEQGYEVAQLKRFIFYLNKRSSQRIASEALPQAGSGLAQKTLTHLLQLFALKTSSTQAVPDSIVCEQVLQNLLGGGSLAISARAYKEIGGMDEDFVGWGGEDEELWDRCQTLKVWRYGTLPIVHLWHQPQSGKRGINGQGTFTAELTNRRRAIPAQDRINELVKRNQSEYK